MDRRRLFLALLWPTALVVLVVVLAFFQYQWLGQVSEADRNRQRIALSARASEFARDFDREINGVYTALQYDATVPDNAANIFANRFVLWREQAAFPQLVKQVYLTDDTGVPDDDAPKLTRFDLDTRAFTSVEWPDSLASVRDRLATMRHKFTMPASPFSSAGNTTFQFVSVSSSPLIASVPALMIPVRIEQRFDPARLEKVLRVSAEPRYLIVELDKAYITGHVLPVLVDKHLSADDYRVEVLEPRPNTKTPPLFRKGLAANATIEHADVTTTFFNVRSDAVRDALSAARGLPAGATMSASSAPAAVGGRMSIVVTDSKAAEELQAVSDRQGVEAALQSRTVVGGRGGGGRGGGASGSVMTVPTAGFSTFSTGAWQLVLQHPAGSLEKAVTKTRRKNLAISFGVLAVLSVSVFLISINAQRSKQLAAQQMDFVATVSHELRTPIAVIRSAAQNLSAGVIDDPARAKKYGELIDTEGRRLTDMVEEVLEFAGISGGKRQFSIAPSDVGRLTTEVMESCGALIREAGFASEVAIAPNLPLVNLDESAYRRALSNLVTNALKYATDGHWIGVTVFQTPDRRVAVAVSDKGRGIDAKDLPHIFDAFYRGGYAKDRQIHGNGLGLSLVKRIVDAHGGDVSVQTSPAGSTFTMTFSESAQ